MDQLALRPIECRRPTEPCIEAPCPPYDGRGTPAAGFAHRLSVPLAAVALGDGCRNDRREALALILYPELEIAVRCAWCSQVHPLHLTLFCRGELSAQCTKRRPARLARLERRSRRGYRLMFTCYICGEQHGLDLSLGQLLRSEVQALLCPHTGVELGFAGRPGVAAAAALALQRELASIERTMHNKIGSGVLHRFHGRQARFRLSQPGKGQQIHRLFDAGRDRRS